MGRRQKREFDKYALYQKAVQSPDVDAKFFYKLYKKLRGRDPRALREDFCGTFATLCEWVKLGPKQRGMGVDLDPEPLEYGRFHNMSGLTDEQASRLHIIQGDVQHVHRPQVDIVAALNFSYFIFRDRKQLREYFRECREALKNNGILLVDCFGGADCQGPIVDKTRKRGFWYFWEQSSFDPISNRARFHIHFKRDGERIRRNVFVYDWRMWSLPEVQEIMIAAGFRKTLIFWEDDHGVFKPAAKGEPCEAWIAYIVGLK